MENLFNIDTFAKENFKQFAKYVNSLKHGASFKYSRVDKKQKTFLNILYTRGLDGEYYKFYTVKEATALGFFKPSIDQWYCAGVNLKGQPIIIPLGSEVKKTL